MAARNGWFESNFLTLQGQPKHTSRGYFQSHTCDFSPLFPFRGIGPPPSSTEPRSALTMWPYGNKVKTVGWYVPHSGSIRYLNLPITIFSACGKYVQKLDHHYTDVASTIKMNIINSPAHQPYDSNISKQATPISCKWQAITQLLPNFISMAIYRSTHTSFYLVGT
jgi:hypothetical protein